MDSQNELSDRAKKILGGDVRTIARVLSDIEAGPGPEVTSLLAQLFSRAGRSTVIGVTGSPGSGKSTLVSQLARLYRSQGIRVAVIAVDPTSPISGGAILGDRIRMQALASDSGVFIRSMATRGRLGGLSGAVDDAIVVLRAADYGVILVETVGVGQDEVDIVATADVTVLVLVPGMGDSIQAIKAGTMEIADIFVINKADHVETSKTERDLRLLQEFGVRPDGWRQPILKTVATAGEGIDLLAGAIADFGQFVSAAGEEFGRRRVAFRKQRALGQLREQVQRLVFRELEPERLDALLKELEQGEADPYTASRELLLAAARRLG